MANSEKDPIEILHILDSYDNKSLISHMEKNSKHWNFLEKCCEDDFLIGCNESTKSLLVDILMKIFYSDENHGQKIRTLTLIRKVTSVHATSFDIPFYKNLSIDVLACQVQLEVNDCMKKIIAFPENMPQNITVLIRFLENVAIAPLKSCNSEYLDTVSNVVEILSKSHTQIARIQICFRDLIKSDTLLSMDARMRIWNFCPETLENEILKLLDDLYASKAQNDHNQHAKSIIANSFLLKCFVSSSEESKRLVFWKIFNILISIFYRTNNSLITDVLETIIGNIQMSVEYLPENLQSLSILSLEADTLDANSREKTIILIINQMNSLLKSHYCSVMELKASWLLFPSWFYCFIQHLLTKAMHFDNIDDALTTLLDDRRSVMIYSQKIKQLVISLKDCEEELEFEDFLLESMIFVYSIEFDCTVAKRLSKNIVQSSRLKLILDENLNFISINDKGKAIIDICK